jgi:hypothetical protein
MGLVPRFLTGPIPLLILIAGIVIIFGVAYVLVTGEYKNWSPEVREIIHQIIGLVKRPLKIGGLLAVAVIVVLVVLVKHAF